MTKRGRKTKKKNRFITNLLLIATIIFIASIYYLDILPIRYLLYIIGGITILDILLLINIKRNKKKTISYIVTLLIITIMTLFSYYIIKTNGLINNLNLNYKTYNYSIIVLKNSKYNDLIDIEDKKLGYYKTEGKETTKSLNKINDKIKTNNIEYTDTEKLTNDLIREEIDAILIEDTYLKILEEEKPEESANFKELTKAIYKFTIIVKTESFTKDIDVTKKPFNIYISGIDTYGEISSVSRSDVNMVVTVNPETNQILLTSIPRDYYVQLHGKTGYKDKLTHAGLYGVDTSLKTLEDLLDIEINYYIKVNFTSVINIVDSIGGVEVYSDYSFTSLDGYNYSKGYNKVNGEEALSFARERKAFSQGDRQRGKNQQALLEAMFRKCTSPSIITRYNSLLNSVKGSFVTNMPNDRLTALLKRQLKDRTNWIITANSLDGNNSSNYTYSYSASKLYVMEPDQESLNNGKELIKKVQDGETLESTYNGNPENVKSVTKSTPKAPAEKPKEEPKKEEPKEGLKVELNKDKTSIKEGEEYTYYGFKATYNKEDITDKTTYELTIDNNTFNDYKEMIYYITNNLKEGEYTIIYKITYKDETTIKEENLTIEKKEIEPEENIEEKEEPVENTEQDTINE